MTEARQSVSGRPASVRPPVRSLALVVLAAACWLLWNAILLWIAVSK